MKVTGYRIIFIIGIYIIFGLHNVMAESEVSSSEKLSQNLIVQQPLNADSFITNSKDINIAIFGNGDFTSSNASHLYNNSWGVGGELSVNLSRILILTSAQINTAQSNNMWCDRYTIISFVGGFAYPILKNNKTEIDGVFKYGLITHFNGETWYLNQRGEMGLRLSQEVMDNITPFIDVSLILIFATPSNTFMYNSSVGIQYTL